MGDPNYHPPSSISPTPATIPQPATPPSPRRATGRRVFESLGLFLSVLLIIRVMGAEPYSVPTGSMAPALVGYHWAAECPRCNYPMRVGVPNSTGQRPTAPYGPVVCPNCGDDHLDLEQLPISRGDQLLVNKNVFDLRRPRRWEIAVFRCPAQADKEFVKRVIGLPGESVQIFRGDILIDHDLARKTLAECKRLRVPVFDNSYQPGPDGWRLRWETLPTGGAGFLEGNSLRLDGTQQPDDFVWLGYRHWNLDEHKEQPIRDEYSYNGCDRVASATVHDFMLECDLEVLHGEGEVAFGITDGHEQLTAELPVGVVRAGARLLGRQIQADCQEKVYRSAPDFCLQAGKTYRVELAFIDRRATLAVDGRSPFTPVDRPFVEERSGVVRPVQLGARGVEVRVHNLRLYRDAHYAESGQHGVREPVYLGAGQYYVLGDNSRNSDDSRFWSDKQGRPTPIPEENFVGKPFLVHLPSQAVHWQGLGRQWQHQSIRWDMVRWLR